MTPSRSSRGFSISRLLGVVAVFAGAAIVLFEFMSVGDISLVGATIGAAGGAVLIFSNDDTEEAEEEGAGREEEAGPEEEAGREERP